MNTRKSVQLELKKYCHFARPYDFIEVCEWTNGEGFDVTLSNVKGDKLFQLTYGEFEALISASAKLTAQ